MPYLLYSVSFLLLVTATALYFTRSHWLPYLPDLPFPGRDYIYSRLPSSFAGDMDAGLSSSTFDLAANIESGDGRAGLDDRSKAEILKIMKKRRLKFDDARRAYMQQRFKANGIGPDGRPLDPKAVTFS
ncbi:hypothetical protein CGRA01v4_07115 [Colletotrichum graminicola]|uniref:Uncharacterized protein n=1 Tax=Colletotrichum graminicola (strain M1.001 / M2 / FGSC 10212) TaxID=645133 RepID=E3QCQ7_COLGM|nr:uncharacterized protein GLRG_03789 [Colletotrichum graminicola M1.001]EFQ28645.1 hypothetical protein GLRG_03789 [Colletotrichum graminicola M1.001]WDK15834.1 hypothetical protein CGRA01v4_07115 [Colletotrichum graminicola]